MAYPEKTATELARFSGRGKVWSYTIIPNGDYAPEGFEYLAPYAVAIVKLEEGTLVTGMMTDIDLTDIEIGMEVEMVVRKKRVKNDQSILVYGVSFRPPIPRSSKTLAETIAEIER